VRPREEAPTAVSCDKLSCVNWHTQFRPKVDRTIPRSIMSLERECAMLKQLVGASMLALAAPAWAEPLVYQFEVQDSDFINTLARQVGPDQSPTCWGY